jgi:phospholipid/cholesterol/gamma-HCH transport system substrate-binding protein
MPRTRSLAWSELKLGVLTIVSVVIAATTVVMLTGSGGFFWQQYKLKTRFSNVAGLKPGSPVRLAGIAIGVVNDWEFVGDQVDVTFSVNKNRRSKITDQSTATLGAISVLGEATVDITPATKGTPIPDYGYVPGGKVPYQISDITDQAGEGMKELRALLQDVNQGKGTIGKFMTDDRVYTELQRSMVTLGDLAEGLKQGKGAAGKLLNDKTTADELDRSLKNLESLTAQLNSGQGTLGVLLRDDSFARSLTSTTDSLQALVGKINRGEGSAGKLLNDTALYDKMNSVMGRLDQLTTQLNAGEGSLGLFLKDRQLYDKMNKLASDASDLLLQIKKDPKQYLNVKVSIF